MSEGRRTIYVIIALQFVILTFAVLIGHSLGKMQARDNRDNDVNQPAMIREAMLLIQNKYKEKNVDTEKLIYGAIDGMVKALGDQYSQFMAPEVYTDIMDDTRGEFGGLGVEIGITSINGYNRLTITTAIESTPAKRAGLEAGDYIMKIDGESTFGISLDVAKKKLRGRPGTKVSLTVMKANEEEPVDIVVTRGIIQPSTVKYMMLENDIGYIRISQFADTTPPDADKALDEFEKVKVKGIVLDLRTNPGGTLSAAVEVASDFLKSGQLVVYTKGRAPEDHKEFFVQRGTPHPWHPLVVLVDQWSASGSEIVVGAIKDHKRGLIVGEDSATFGKGSVQTIFPMRDGKTGLKLTVADYYTPSGKNISDKVGIDVDIRYPGIKLMPSEARMYRKLLVSKSLDEFVKEAGDDILKRLDRKQEREIEDPDIGLFNSFVKKLSQEDIILSENLIKMAIAEKTKNETDEYEYDPVIKFAISHLMALEIFKVVKT